MKAALKSLILMISVTLLLSGAVVTSEDQNKLHPDPANDTYYGSNMDDWKSWSDINYNTASEDKFTIRKSSGDGPDDGDDGDDSDDVLPVAAFNCDVTSGEVPLIVNFTDTSTNANRRSWDMDGDGSEDSGESNPVHTYTSAGTYTVSLTVTNDAGVDMATNNIEVTVTETEEIPEFPTIALPVLSIIGLMFILQRKRLE